MSIDEAVEWLNQNGVFLYVFSQSFNRWTWIVFDTYTLKDEIDFLIEKEMAVLKNGDLMLLLSLLTF
jgi:hypothetical protein